MDEGKEDAASMQLNKGPCYDNGHAVKRESLVRSLASECLPLCRQIKQR